MLRNVRLFSLGAAAPMVGLWLSSVAWAEPLVPAAPVPDVKPAVEAPAAPAPAPAAEPAKEAAKDLKDDAKDVAKETRDAAKDAAKDTRDAVKDTRDAARDAARDTRDAARDATRAVPPAVPGAPAARDAARDTRDAVRDTRDAARDTVRDVRGAARDTIQDTRAGVRASVNANANARANLRWQDLRSADLGLWFGSNVNNGLVISDVATQGPIANLGFREGDRIVSVAGQPVTRQADFMNYLFTSNVAGGRVPIIVNRGGQQQTVYMQPQTFMTSLNAPQQAAALEQLGIIPDDRVQDRAVVWKVMPRSPAYFAGMRGGDAINSFAGQPVSNLAQLNDLAAKAEGEAAPIPVEVQRGDKARQLEIEPAGASPAPTTALRPDYDNAAPALAQPAAGTPAAVAPAPAYNTGYNNGYVPRRGLFRGRR